MKQANVARITHNNGKRDPILRILVFFEFLIGFFCAVKTLGRISNDCTEMMLRFIFNE
jgi:hypothetical protein